METPRTLGLPRGDYVIHFTRPNYVDALEGVLLGPGSFKEVSVTLDSVSTVPDGTPPTVSISVTPDEITEGESATVTVGSDAEVGILLPIAVFTTAGTYTDFPDQVGTVTYSFAGFRGGKWAIASDSVFVRPAPSEDPENGQVLVYSNPRSNVEVYNITPTGELVTTGQIICSPFVIEREPGVG